MATKKGMPEILYVYAAVDGDDVTYVAERTPAEVLEGASEVGPILVGCYKLQGLSEIKYEVATRPVAYPVGSYEVGR